MEPGTRESSEDLEELTNNCSILVKATEESRRGSRIGREVSDEQKRMEGYDTKQDEISTEF